MKIKTGVKIKMNKRGDVPIYILVLGVFAICTLLIVSFSISFNKLKSNFEAVNAVGLANSYVEEFQFSKNLFPEKENSEIISMIKSQEPPWDAGGFEIEYDIIPSDSEGDFVVSIDIYDTHSLWLLQREFGWNFGRGKRMVHVERIFRG